MNKKHPAYIKRSSNDGIAVYVDGMNSYVSDGRLQSDDMVTALTNGNTETFSIFSENSTLILPSGRVIGRTQVFNEVSNVISKNKCLRSSDITPFEATEYVLQQHTKDIHILINNRSKLTNVIMGFLL